MVSSGDQIRGSQDDKNKNIKRKKRKIDEKKRKRKNQRINE